MKEVLCVKSYVEDGDEFWSEGSYYTVLSETEEGYKIEHNFGGVGFVYAEDFDEYFEKAE